MRKSRQQSLLLLLALGSLSCLGCGIGHQQTYTRYEPKDDSFHLLKVYSNLNATTGNQMVDEKVLEHIVSHWKDRALLIPQPIPFFDPAATVYRRTGQHTYEIHSLGVPADKPRETQTTQVDLNAIEVLPGEFSLNEHGNACYYHQVKIPGSTVDAMLKEMSPTFAEGLAKLVEHQNQLRNKGTTAQWTWDEVRKELVKYLKNRAHKGPSPDSKLLPLDQESLKLLAQAGAKGQVDLSRKGDVFQLVIPLSQRDSLEAIATFDLVKPALAERIKNDPKVEPWSMDLFQAFSLEHKKAQGLAISLSYTKLAKSIHAENKPPTPEAKLKTNYKNTATALKAKGIPFKKSIALDKLKEKYTQGK